LLVFKISNLAAYAAIAHYTTMKNYVNCPVYKREQWLRWQKLFEGTQAPMLWTYDEWLENHHKMIEKFKADGHGIMQRIEVDIDEYLAWTKKSGLPVDGYTRTDFSGHIMRERMKAAGNLGGA